MDNDLAYPLVLLDSSAAGAEEAQPFSFASAKPTLDLPPTDNFGMDEAFIKFFTEEVYPVITWCRVNRMNLEEEWRSIRRMRVQMHDYGRRYYGRSDFYLPFYARNRGTLVPALLSGLFPSDEYMGVNLRGDGDPDDAKAVQALLQWEFEENGEVERQMEPFIGQLIDWGNSVMKFWYRKELRTVIRAARRATAAGEPGIDLKTVRAAVREGLGVSTRNMLFWFAYPFTADALEDCTMCFEDVEVARGFGEEMFRRELWSHSEGVQAFKSAPLPPNYLVSQQDLLTNTWGVTPPATGIQGDKKLGDTRVVQEIWTFAPVPDALYREGEMKGELVPVQVVAAGAKVLMARRNPHFHQRPPYLFTASNREPGNLHGYAEGRMLRGLQYLSNDSANQMNDVGVYSLNPISKFNPAYFVGAVPPIKPGAAWKMMDIDAGHKFDRPPADLIQYGIQLVQFWMSSGDDFAGAPPVLQGAKGARTATSTSILARNAANPIQQRVKLVERDIMVPLMRGTWSNAMQFRDEGVNLRVMGRFVQVTREMLVGDWMFRWLASSQAVNQAQRAQQLIGFIQAMMPLIPQLNQLGYVFDPVPLLERIYSDGFGMRGFKDVIRPAQATQGMQPGQPLGPVMGGIQSEQQDRVRSALEQVYGKFGAPDMAPGEGDDFAQVRSQADQLAAQIGRNGGASPGGVLQ